MKSSTEDQVEGKVQEKVGQIKKVFGKKNNGVSRNGMPLRATASSILFSYIWFFFICKKVRYLYVFLGIFQLDSS